MSIIIIKISKNFENILRNKNNIPINAQDFCITTTGNDKEGNILVFLPGIADIRRAQEELVDIDAELCILHSSISLEEQKKVIRPQKDGHRRVILSSAIAVLAGTVAKTYLQAIPLKLISGILFIIIGGFSIYGYFTK